MAHVQQGTVTSIGKMLKTVTVTVPRRVQIGKVPKPLLRTKKYLVHDEDHVCHLGDSVTIRHTPALSNRKHFRIQTINRRGKSPQDYSTQDPEWKHMEQVRVMSRVRREQDTAAKVKKYTDLRERRRRGAEELGELFAGAQARADVRAVEAEAATEAMGGAEAEEMEEEDGLEEKDGEGNTVQNPFEPSGRPGR